MPPLGVGFTIVATSLIHVVVFAPPPSSEMLDVTEAEMRACQFTHLVTPKLRRKHERVRQTKRRLDNGAVPRSVYETQAISQAKPWEDEGISRATWYRRRETSSYHCTVENPQNR